MKLEKEFEISTGHRLPNHKGGCFNLHGHNYWVKIILDFGNIDKYIDNEDGYFIDFALIKKTINDNFDHHFILYEQDSFVEVLKDLPGVILVPYIPTAENMSLHMKELILDILPENTDVHIELNETKSSKVIQ